MKAMNLFKKKIIEKSKDFSWTPDRIFICLMLFGMMMLLVRLFLSHGTMFSEIFFTDSLDTGMDFFHSIEYTKGRSPYAMYRTLYPPLANLFFYILFCMVPAWQYDKWQDSFSGGIAARGTSADLRVAQPTMLLFIIFIMLFAVLFVSLVKKVLATNRNAGILAFLLLFSYGILYAMERGNIIVLSLLCTMFFVFYKDSENKIISELALLSLAAASGLKLYPALFGILLLYDKQYKKTVRTVIYGVLLFAVPFCFFEEGLIDGCKIFLDVLLNKTVRSGVVTASGNSAVINDVLITGNITLHTIFNTIATIICKLFDITLNVPVVESVLHKLSYIMIFAMFLCGFFVKKNWQKYLICSLGIIFCSTPGIYIISFLLIPLLCFIKEEPELEEGTILPFVALIITQMLLPVSKKLFIGELSAYYLRFQVCLLILFLTVFYEAAKGVIFMLKDRKKSVI